MIDIREDDYVACICEGPTEAAVIGLLLDSNALVFDREQLLDGAPLSGKLYRDPRRFSEQYLSMDFGGRRLCIVVVQDRKNVKYKICRPYSSKVDLIVYAVTAPEMEMLMIHALGLYNDYKRRHSELKPSEYVAQATKTKTSKLKSREEIEAFYKRHDLVGAIKEHKRKSQKLGGDMVFLADLLAGH